tara:strand:- start:1497 stop:3746 length:2250 start_codon:yes stop_codon:yes gene_type:complete
MAPRNTRVAPETEVRSPARSFLSSLDNFYAPARDQRKQQAFQEGINAFSGIVGQQAADAKQERNAGEASQGVQDALREQAGEEMRGVQSGSIFRQHSKFYMAGLNETRGKAAGARFKADTTQAYQNWEGRHIDDDGTAYRDWMNGRVAEFMGTLGDDQYKVAGALPVINEVANNFAVQHTAFTATRLETESFEAYDEIVSGVFSDLSNGEFDMDEAVRRIASEADDMYLTDGAEANDRVVQAAIRYSNIHNDPDSLLALAKAHDDGSLKLSQVNRERLANAMDAVEADIARNTNNSNARKTAEDKARDAAMMDDWAATLAADPYADVPSIAEVGSAAVRRDMLSLKSASITNAGNVNPSISSGARMLLEADLHDAGTVRERIAILADFTRANPEALTGADTARYTQGILEEARPDSLAKNTLISTRRGNFGRGLADLQLGSGYSENAGSTLRTQGEIAFNEYMTTPGGKVDTNDPEAMNQLMVDAEAYAMAKLSNLFPTLMADKVAEAPELANAMGADVAVADQQQQVAEAAAIELQRIASDVPLEEQPTPFEDPDSGTEYSPTRESFYGELLQGYTDGVDNRARIQSATEVFDSDPEFADRVNELGDKLGINPAALMAVMHFETGGTFGTSTANAAGSGATGLIQFMPSTARALGTTTEELAGMTRVQQMDYVESYFDQFGSSIRGGEVDDIYMAVLWPAAIGKEDGYPIFRQGTTAYEQNAGLDTNRDGTVTKFEAAAKVKATFYGY